MPKRTDPEPWIERPCSIRVLGIPEWRQAIIAGAHAAGPLLLRVVIAFPGYDHTGWMLELRWAHENSDGGPGEGIWRDAGGTLWQVSFNVETAILLGNLVTAAAQAPKPPQAAPAPMTKAQIAERWPQTEAEILAFADSAHTGIAADQLRMAVDLANEAVAARMAPPRKRQRSRQTDPRFRLNGNLNIPT